MSNWRFFDLFLAILWGSLLFAVTHCAAPVASSVLSSQSGTLIIGGSGSAYPALRVLANAFAQRYPRVTVTFESSSQTATAVKYVTDGELDIGAIARPLDEQERQSDLQEIHLARDAVVFAVHHNVAVTAITTAQAQAIYTGALRSWKALGAADRDIVLLDRPEGETAKIALRQFVLGADFPVTPDAVLLSTENDMAEALGSVSDTIGYLSLSYPLRDPTHLHALALDGVMPSIATLQSGAYRVTRTIGIVVKTNRTDDFPIHEFIALANTAEARAALTQAGYAPEENP